jgi:hypothetical protein
MRIASQTYRLLLKNHIFSTHACQEIVDFSKSARRSTERLWFLPFRCDASG